jgi:hypothetical protein
VLFLAFQLGADLGAARALDAPELTDATRRGLAGLEGKLRLSDGAHLEVAYELSAPRKKPYGADAMLHVDGDAWVEAHAGAWRFRLPSHVPILGALSDPLRDGSSVVLVSRFARVSPIALREAASEWPSDGRLVLGTRADAARALSAKASARAAWTALAVLIGFAIAGGSLLVSL